MPKLVTKHDLPEPSIQEKLEGVLRLILPALLLLIAAAAALSFYLSREAPVPEVAADSALKLELPLVYTQADARFVDLRREFEAQESGAAEGYDKHSALVAKADAILQQLSDMDAIVEGLGVTTQDKQVLLTRHQYQKDYWESKRVFHNLRLSRFRGNAQEPAVANVEPRQAVTDNKAVVATSADAAQKVELPADFCPLFGPGAAACRPDAGGKKH